MPTSNFNIYGPLGRQRFLQNFFEHADCFGDLDTQDLHEHHTTLLALQTCEQSTLLSLLKALCTEYGQGYIYLVCLHGHFLLKDTQRLFLHLQGFDVSISFFHQTLKHGYAVEVMVGHRRTIR